MDQTLRANDAPPEMGSERSFGLVFSCVFLIIAMVAMFAGKPVPIWTLVGSGIFAATALFAPKILAPLNLIWFKFGLVLHKIVNPIIMGGVFFLAVMPMGLVIRMMGKDLLRLKLDAAASSYWGERVPPGPEPETFSNQF